jgi:hypothetical protein
MTDGLRDGWLMKEDEPRMANHGWWMTDGSDGTDARAAAKTVLEIKAK